jgi:hypothetical protein
MKLIIAGGRNYHLTSADIERLNRIAIIEVVSGGAKGTDADGEAYAAMKGLPVKQFLADWNTHGRAAGPIRNRQMAEYADAVALFPGGRGTQSMFNEAISAGIEIFDYRCRIKATPEQEEAWHEHKTACYLRWRKQKLASCKAWVEASRDDWERVERLEKIRQRLGKPGKGFMDELYRRLET